MSALWIAFINGIVQLEWAPDIKRGGIEFPRLRSVWSVNEIMRVSIAIRAIKDSMNTKWTERIDKATISMDMERD